MAMRDGGTLYWLLSDHLGSTSLTLDSSGNRLDPNAELRYKPYGDMRYNGGGQKTNYRFTGQRWDQGHGLYWFNSRWFDPLVGRFMQADTIVPEPGNPQALNRYSYVLENPLRYTDPTGHANECGTQAGTSCGGVGPLWPVEIIQAPPDALNNVWAVTELVGSVLAEPADWVITARDFLRGEGSPWALVGLLPLVPSSAGKWADEVASGLAKKIDIDLYAFGNKAGPRPPRSGTDVFPDVGGILAPQTPPFPEGASTFANPSQAPLTGQYHRLPAGTELPSGLDVVADGLDVNVASGHPATHHTIFNTVEMAFDRFVDLFASLPWQYGGKK